jgi:ABC-type multidrug transport system fused ATPase/permease subunit
MPSSLVLRNVTFTYPASKTDTPAISDLSFFIAPGQLVVIVGPNGVGKSTLVKLLTRMHEPTSGTVMVDGQDARTFRLKDLREASAVLSQDHEILGGVSVMESVGLGRWKHKDDQDLIEQAMRQGGAQGLVRKFAQGGETVLRPAKTKSGIGLIPGHSLTKVYEKLEKEADVSGSPVVSFFILGSTDP